MTRQTMRCALGAAMGSGILALAGCGASGGGTGAASGALSAQLRQSWTLTVLPAIEYRTDAAAMNARGDVVGTAQEGLSSVASLWDRSTGERISLGSLGGGDTAPADINARGQVTGVSDTTDGLRIFHAFFWERGVMEDLGTLDPYPHSRAVAMNARGEMVGEAAMATSGPGAHDTRALLWTRTHALVDLGALTEGGVSTARDINPSGAVTGTSTGEDGLYHAVRWVRGAIEDLGTYTPPGESDPLGIDGVAINAAGTVVATHPYGSMAHRFVLVRVGGAWVSVGDLGGGGTSVLDRICLNNAGQIAGWTLDGSGNDRGFFWDGAALHDVGDLGGDYTRAFAVNDAGRVVGTSNDSGGNSRGFLWQSGQMVDLNTLVTPPEGSTITSANQIANDGSMLVTLWHPTLGMTAAVMRPAG